MTYTNDHEVPMRGIIKAISTLQGKMSSPKKNKVNPHLKNKYADLSSIMEALTPHLIDLGLAIVQTTEIKGDMLVLVTQIFHETGTCIRGEYPVRPANNAPQNMGSAMTYARRYALSSILGIVGDDDDDGNAASGVFGETTRARPPKVEAAPEKPKTNLSPELLVKARNLMKAIKATGNKIGAIEAASDTLAEIKAQDESVWATIVALGENKEGEQ